MGWLNLEGIGDKKASLYLKFEREGFTSSAGWSPDGGLH
jgi:hypothetical protein